MREATGPIEALAVEAPTAPELDLDAIAGVLATRAAPHEANEAPVSTDALSDPEEEEYEPDAL